MQSWINFWNLAFWIIIISFISGSSNFIKLLFFSEVTWIVLYNFVITIGSINDDITMMSTSFFILGFAGLEFSLGILLLLIFKRLLKTDSLDDTLEKKKNFYNTFKKNKSNQFKFKNKKNI